MRWRMLRVARRVVIRGPADGLASARGAVQRTVKGPDGDGTVMDVPPGVARVKR